jgi:hypothetical protein
VARRFFENRFPDGLFQGVSMETAQVKFIGGMKAGFQHSIARNPNSIAGQAEIIADRVYQPHCPRRPGQLVKTRHAVRPGRLEGRYGPQYSLAVHKSFAAPAGALPDGHELDEPDMESAPGEGDEAFNLAVVHAAYEDGVDLDGFEAGG